MSAGEGSGSGCANLESAGCVRASYRGVERRRLGTKMRGRHRLPELVVVHSHQREVAHPALAQDPPGVVSRLAVRLDAQGREFVRILRPPIAKPVPVPPPASAVFHGSHRSTLTHELEMWMSAPKGSGLDEAWLSEAAGMLDGCRRRGGPAGGSPSRGERAGLRRARLTLRIASTASRKWGAPSAIFT